MAHEIDGEGKNARAIYARKPAWHGLGVVKEDGWFSAEEALTVLNPNKEPVRKVRAGALVDGAWIETDDLVALVDVNADTGQPRILSYMTPEYGVVQLEDQFRFLDEVVGAIGGAHYESAAKLRKGRQVFMTIDTGAIVLDEGGVNDRVQKYILGVNSYDGSLAFRVKMTNVRVECANLLAMALRGSSDKVVTGDWSTRHTSQVLQRAEMAKMTLGLWSSYNDQWAIAATEMIHTPLSDDAFDRIVRQIMTSDKEGVKEVNQEAVAEVRNIYELSPSCKDIFGTVWGGLQATTEYMDWHVKVRGGKVTTAQEARLRRQFEGKGQEQKQDAWDRFADWGREHQKVTVSV